MTAEPFLLLEKDVEELLKTGAKGAEEGSEEEWKGVRKEGNVIQMSV